MKRQRLSASPTVHWVTLFGVTALLSIIFFMTYTVARAESVVVADTIPPQNTNWADELIFPPFDPEWGQLTEVMLTFETPITGSVRYENVGDETVTITSAHAVTINLELPDGTVLYSMPSAARNDIVPPYDGISDFGGTSGASFEMTATMVVTKVFSTPDELALFYGSEPMRFPITATGSSKILGPGNFDAIFRAQAASAGVYIYFVYREPEFVVEKLTNQRDADDPNGIDVPVVAPGAPITWTYLITNVGSKVIPLADITIIDSDPHVHPRFDPTSDDGDQRLSPGEVWRYYAVGTALNLRLDHIDTTIVEGCQGAVNPESMRAYQNMVTVQIEDVIQHDRSHYCNPTPRRLLPAIEFAKLLNGSDADDPNAPDVPYVFPGTLLQWTYLITNTGEISFTFDEIQLVDDDPTLTITFDETSDNGDRLLAPGEVWRYTADGTARNLLFDTTEITVVAGCDPMHVGTSYVAYRNIATVIVNDLVITDPAHYCNFPPTSVPVESNPRARFYFLYMPLIANPE